ncbi:hypothetical protein PC116_g16419 [Phytophthora cactorum]|nr:hypothetical protein PC115_g22337 [Phytophthora cactorum]KAG2969108.1 hypothetical protein PC118_g17623 [Phytophthora cactorum]KAG3059979.1 hypothetical protein PC121_g13716 [Phytophthora cactorum]KAG3066596.1 hypothetical protein PC122_g17719 [Phytophthora cactorum]KAG3126832.1 hypothetical protein C6341_g25198 [Phytophthora cactorum]
MITSALKVSLLTITLTALTFRLLRTTRLETLLNGSSLYVTAI